MLALELLHLICDTVLVNFKTFLLEPHENSSKFGKLVVPYERPVIN